MVWQPTSRVCDGGMSKKYCQYMAPKEEIERVLRSYAQAWLASDLEKVLAAYHDDIELHYMGKSPLAGTHRGRDAAFAALAQASVRTSRKLVDVKDVLVGDSLGALLAIEDLGDPPRRVQRILLYRVQDEKLRECWLFDEDQRFIDQLWSKEP
jgi:ketosteroid isomerase-like protein